MEKILLQKQGTIPQPNLGGFIVVGNERKQGAERSASPGRGEESRRECVGGFGVVGGERKIEESSRGQ